MFIQNKYNNWYYQIIKRASNRLLEGYIEKHHIIPKSLNGSDDRTNLVTLTAREHFICHLLLTKMVAGTQRYKMIKAAKMLSNVIGPGQSRYKVTNRVYAILKENIEVPIETRIKMSVAQKTRFLNTTGTFLNKTHSKETRKKMSISASKPKSTSWKEKLLQIKEFLIVQKLKRKLVKLYQEKKMAFLEKNIVKNKGRKRDKKNLQLLKKYAIIVIKKLTQ